MKGVEITSVLVNGALLRLNSGYFIPLPGEVVMPGGDDVPSGSHIEVKGIYLNKPRTWQGVFPGGTAHLLVGESQEIRWKPSGTRTTC